MGTGKYKIGARVRDEDGDEGVIVGKRKGERLVEYDKGKGFSVGLRVTWPKSSLTPIPAIDETPAAAEQEHGEPAENKFKVGDRVRFTDECREYWWFGPQKKYKDGTVSKTDDGGEIPIHVRCSNGETAFVNADQIEPLPVAAEAQGAGEAPAGEKWDAKPGNRVKVIRHKWTDAPVGSLGTVRDVKSHGVTATIDGGDGFAWFFHWGDVQFQPLTIEPGKYYRTRDGRKVGPVYRSGLVDWPWESEVAYHKADGTAPYLPEYDLVAEWSSEDGHPVAVAPATATPAAPKFKVGDRVRVKCGDLTGTIASRNSAGAMAIRYDGSDHVGFQFWHDDELDPAPADTPVSADATATPITKGSLVQLSAPALVTGIDRHHAHLLLATGGAYTLPVAALVAA